MRNRSKVLRPALGMLTALGLSLGMTACGDSDDGGHGNEHGSERGPANPETATNGDVFNDADVEFASAMIPHHAQAVQMVVLAQDRPLDPAVSRLASQIRDAQVPEIETMSDWLVAWGEPVPETSLDHANAGHDMDDMEGGMEGMDEMPGMMSQEEMDTLAGATDAEFQTMWLEMMIEHHEGAIEMAQLEQRDGEFAGAIALAETIERTQKSEIELIEGLLA